MLPVSQPFCADCAIQLGDIVSACPACAEPVVPWRRCACHRHGLALTAARGAVLYEGPAIAAVLRFKHGGRRDLARPLGRALASALLSAPLPGSGPPLVTPVPLHPRRLRQRGYNQALELARVVTRAADWPARPHLAVDLLSRTRDTPSLGHLGVAERRTAVENAFFCPKRPFVKGATVVLVDDVMTTGATLNECARCLHLAGAAHVVVAVFARAVTD